MKIIHFINFFEPNCGYEEDLTSKFQTLDGHNVTVLTTYYLPPRAGRPIHRSINLYSSVTEDGVKIIRLPFIPLPSAATFHVGSLIYLAFRSYDVIHIHGLLNPISPLIALLSKIKGSKVIIDNHDFKYSSHQLSYNGLNFFKNVRRLEFIFVRKYIGKLLLKISDSAITFEDITKNFLIDFYDFPPSRITTATIGFDQNHFFPSPKCISKSNVLTIGFVGQLIPRKKIEDLIHLIHLLPDNFQLKLIGSISKSYYMRLQCLCQELRIEDKVIFSGLVDYRLLPQAIKSLDVAIYLNSSSIVCNQILGCGIPILVGSSQQFAPSAEYYGKVINMNLDYIHECFSWITKDLKDYPVLSCDSIEYRSILKNLSFSKTYNIVQKTYLRA